MNPRLRPRRHSRYLHDARWLQIGGPARLLRRWRPDRNPLRRRWDRVGTAVLGVLLAVFLAGAPFAAHAAGGWAYAVAAGQARTEQATRHHVPATLLTAVSSWNAYAAGAGSTVTIWVTPSGDQAVAAPVAVTEVPGFLGPLAVTGRHRRRHRGRC